MNKINVQNLLKSTPTPFYLFDIDTLFHRIDFLKKSLPKQVSLCYAMKANTFILPWLHRAVERFEVCSPGELHIYRQLQLPLEKLVVSGIVKDPDLLDELAGSEVPVYAFTVESQKQFRLLKSLSEKHRRPLPLLLRLTSENQFGLNEEELQNLVLSHKDFPFLEIRGIQYFSGTQKTSCKRLKREIDRLDQFLFQLSETGGFAVRELEFGPGIPVSYFPADLFDEDAYFKELSNFLSGMKYKTKITLELGRSMAASCGTYCSRVVDTKTNGGQNYAILDGGIHHLVYYGQSMAMKQPFYELFPKRSSGTEKKWNLCGSLCTVNDILVKQLPLKDLKAGDVILFQNTGAYCMTEGISLFLSRDLPRVVIRLPDGSLLTAREAAPTYPLNCPAPDPSRPGQTNFCPENVK